MAHISSFRGNCEIVEIEEGNLDNLEHDKNVHLSREMRTEEKVRRSLPSNFGHVSSLEDDLNQVFEMFNRRKSSQGTGYSPHNGIGTSKKHTSKKPMRASTSSVRGISERVNLKQAFRGLCISQASEMAAMKRSAKSGGSSEAGRIMTLYRNVVVEDNSSLDSQDEGKGGLLEISLMPEEPAPSINGARSSSIQNKKVLESYEARNEVTEAEVLSREKTPIPASSSNVGDEIVKMSQSASMQNGKNSSSSEPEGVSSVVETSPSEKLSSLSDLCSPAATDNSLKIAESSQIEDELLFVSGECMSQASLTELSQDDRHLPAHSASHSSDCRNSLEVDKSTTMRIGTAPASPAPEFPTSSTGMSQKEEHADATSSYHSDLYRHTWDPMNSSSTPFKSMDKEFAGKSAQMEDKGSAVREVQKGVVRTIPSAGSTKGIKVKKSTRSASRLVKPVVKTKIFVKRKSKKEMISAHTPKVTLSEFNNAMYPSPNNLVCPRCQCVLADEWEEGSEELPLSSGASFRAELSPFSHVASPTADPSPLSCVANCSAEEGLDNTFSDVGTPTYNLNSTSKSKEVVEVGEKSKSREKGEFTQSSKSSPEECSSSTNSEESNLSRPSCCDRPHMSKDVRWQAIRQFRMQNGAVSLRHFNLLKKLGCGDIGTVYLAELIGTNCLFAIKVMDNEFLVRRKKIMRAQTEREILRILDHPFLPTLYCQFTSDNLSCLVMEYCPGGDLHVLRQKQPGKCFTEQAARFYVAEVLLALEYLHMLGVIYRDLKPENILVREDGHIMLSDFDLSLRCAVNPTLLVSASTTETTRSMSGPFKDTGCAQPLCIQQPSCQVSCFGPKIIRGPSTKPRKLKSEPADLLKPLPLLVAEPTSARSNSFVGTHEYLAPEIIKGEGHGSAVDWWTFGIFLYELLYGRTPFRGPGNEETLANVVLQSLKFPDSPLVSLQARDLINRLLVKEPENRLGSERGSAEIKKHPFFEGLNWALIRCAVPPELPEFHRSYGVANGPPQVNNSNNIYSSDNNASTGKHLGFEVF